MFGGFGGFGGFGMPNSFQSFVNQLNQQNWVMAQENAQRRQNEERAAQAAAQAEARRRHEEEMAALNAQIAANEKELHAMQVARENDALRRTLLRKQTLSEQDVLGGEEGMAQILIPILG